MTDQTDTNYQRVQSRLLAWLCLKEPEFGEMTTLAKAQWLMMMGFPRSEAASILGSTDESLRVMISTATKKARTKAATP